MQWLLIIIQINHLYFVSFCITALLFVCNNILYLRCYFIGWLLYKYEFISIKYKNIYCVTINLLLNWDILLNNLKYISVIIWLLAGWQKFNKALINRQIPILFLIQFCSDDFRNCVFEFFKLFLMFIFKLLNLFIFILILQLATLKTLYCLI